MRVIASSPALQAGLASMLSADPGISVVAEPTGLAGMAQSHRAVDVVVVVSNGAALGWREPSNDLSSTAPVIYLSNEPVDVRSLISSGSSWGLLPLDASAGELQASVRALAIGLQVAAPALLSGSGDVASQSGPLTERETEVLGLLSKGLANKQIAAELGISEHTVKFHISSIYGKLGATNRTQAVREGLRNGWIVL